MVGGVRVAVEFPVAPSRLLLRLDGEMLAPVNPASVERSRQTVFQVSGWNAGLGLEALFAP